MTKSRRLPQGTLSNEPRAMAKAAALAAAGWALLGPAGAQEPRRTESVAAIRAAAVAYVRSQLPRAEIAEVSAGALDERLRLAHCATALAVQPAGGGSMMARSTVAVGCAAPVHWTVYVPVTVVRRVPVLVLRHAVARGAHVGPADVSVQTRTVTGFASAYLGSPAELSGRSVERTLASGTSLTVDMFTQDPVVRRGQEVTLVVQAGGIDVRATGRALEDAGAGARLRVENLSSQRIVEGVAEASGIVQVAD